MSFNIDITLAPPTLADIASTREQAVTERAIYRKKNIRFSTVLFTIVVIYVTIMIKYVIPMLGDVDPEWGILTYFLPYFTFGIFVIGNHLHTKHIEKPSRALDKLIAALNEAKEDEINRVKNDKEQPDVIISYIEKVTAKGRSLVNAEIEAIQLWHDSQKRAS